MYNISEKGYNWNPVTCICENGKYLASIIGDSVIVCDETIKETKSVTISFNEKNKICETKCFYIFVDFINHNCIIDRS